MSWISCWVRVFRRASYGGLLNIVGRNSTSTWLPWDLRTYPHPSSANFGSVLAIIFPAVISVIAESLPIFHSSSQSAFRHRIESVNNGRTQALRQEKMVGREFGEHRLHPLIFCLDSSRPSGMISCPQSLAENHP